MKIYTKTGDDGTTGTLSGRLPKTHAIFEVLGTLDELNAVLGLCERTETITTLQTRLFDLGAIIACQGEVRPNLQRPIEEWTLEMEGAIDRMDEEMPPLRNFILPSGPLHLARTIARRAERQYLVARKDATAIQIFLNRLSDYLFTLARWTTTGAGGHDVAYSVSKARLL